MVAEGYDELARRYPERIVALDGERPVAEVAASVERATLAALASPAPLAARSAGDVR
jgi:thymidylate kinase